jgi:cytochrome c-type biogenesis protein
MVLPVLAAAAGTGVPWLAAALLLTFGLARGVPIAVAGTAAGSVKQLRRLAPWVPRIEKAGGALLLVAAVYFLYQSAVYRGWVPPLDLVV